MGYWSYSDTWPGSDEEIGNVEPRKSYVLVKVDIYQANLFRECSPSSMLIDVHFFICSD